MKAQDYVRITFEKNSSAQFLTLNLEQGGVDLEGCSKETGAC